MCGLDKRVLVYWGPVMPDSERAMGSAAADRGGGWSGSGPGRSPGGSHCTRSARPWEDRHARLIVLGVASLS